MVAIMLVRRVRVWPVRVWPVVVVGVRDGLGLRQLDAFGGGGRERGGKEGEADADVELQLGGMYARGA